MVVQSVSHVWFFETPWIAAGQASLSITISQSLLKFMSIESVDVIQPSCPLPSNHLTISRLFFYSVEMYTAIICCYSNHTNLLQLVSTYLLGYSLRNNITAMGVIRMLDCDDFHFVYDTFPSPVIWWHHHLYFEGCTKRRTVWREWSFMVSTCTGESHCLVGLVTGLFVGDTISV